MRAHVAPGSAADGARRARVLLDRGVRAGTRRDLLLASESVRFGLVETIVGNDGGARGADRRIPELAGDLFDAEYLKRAVSSFSSTAPDTQATKVPATSKTVRRANRLSNGPAGSQTATGRYSRVAGFCSSSPTARSVFT